MQGGIHPVILSIHFLPFEPAAHAAGLHFLRDGAEHGRLPPLLGDLAVLPCGVMRSMPPPPLSLFLDAIRDALEGVEDGRRGHVAAAGSGVVCAGRPPCRCGGLWWPSGVVRDHSYKRAGGWACTRQHGGSLFHRRMDFSGSRRCGARSPTVQRRLQAVARAAECRFMSTSCIL